MKKWPKSTAEKQAEATKRAQFSGACTALALRHLDLPIIQITNNDGQTGTVIKDASYANIASIIESVAMEATVRTAKDQSRVAGAQATARLRYRGEGPNALFVYAMRFVACQFASFN